MEKYIKEVKGNKLSVFFVSDNHEGNANHNGKAFRKAVQYIKNQSEDRPVSVILGGDMADCINVGDPRFSPAEVSEKYSLRDLKDLPRKQFQKVYEDLKPIKDLIDCALIGNHEESFIKHNGFDVYDYLCSDLIGCYKLGFSALVRYKVNAGGSVKSFTGAVSHGTGGGGFREGYPVNHVLDISKKYNVDFNLIGHLHKMTTQSFKYMSMNQVDDIIYETKHYGTSGCFLDTYREGTRGYFEGRKGMLSDIGFLEYKIERRKIEGKNPLDN
jgi:hypothetical protein